MQGRANTASILCKICANERAYTSWAALLKYNRAMQSVLVVDDDPHIREVVCYALQQAGFATHTAADGAAALDMHRAHSPDLIVLDILMPELDGLTACAELRKISNVPIVLLSSRDEEVDRVLGLEMGADDYVGKPFSPRELVARVKANLRRHEINASEPSPVIAACGYEIDLDKLEASWHETPLNLTHTEFQLLRALVSRPEKVYTRDALMQAAYDVRRVVSHRTIDSHIRRLREKLTAIGAPGIRTVHGVGFTLLES